MTELFRNVMNIIPKIFTFAKVILSALTEPFAELWARLVDVLPTWAELITTPIAWIINTILPYNGSLLDVVFLYIIPFYVVWTIGKYFIG